ncbi:hormogonium polysaccharide biosynthesis glycosyltransferase HpsE [Pannus brasiliensis CCIBt3594]|uniref:Hormogonium polysaccharide biosynthesis glycosyltransferase HpsE n=1 Tax=Pannus brasiliensis CCIBt3594 TaxID=1427578 RepID=A0AAW9R1L1_9CHRO
MDVSIVIPTYNGASRLPLVLEKLQSQTGIESIAGEILVIDNNSTDNTAEITRSFQENWHCSFPLRYYFEPRPGVAFARQRGVREASGDSIAFLDDDNLPIANWISAVHSFGKSHPKAGAYGGRIIGDLEIDPPENFEKIAQFLAIRDHGSQPRLFEPERLRLPPSAGLVVRRSAWLDSVPPECALTGPRGAALMRGEDYEILLYLHKRGWEIWYNPEMTIHHAIPRQRLTRDYLLPLARKTGLVTCHLRVILASDREKPSILLRTLFGNFKRIIFHFLKYRQHFYRDVTIAFEFEFFWGGFLSPLYYLQQISKIKS